jgi:hypothetical protein
MAQRNLLDLVQTILEALGESQVDSIEETGPSLQVANIIRDVYYEGLANRNWAHKNYVTSLQPLGVATPTHLVIATDIKEIEKVNYNKAKVSDTRVKYAEVDYKDPVAFLDYCNDRRTLMEPTFLFVTTLLLLSGLASMTLTQCLTATTMKLIAPSRLPSSKYTQ